MKLKPVAEAHESSTGLLKQVREGISTVLDSPWLWITITIAALANVTQFGPLAVALPFLVDQRFGANVGVLGLLKSAEAVGAVLSALWLGRFSTLRHRGVQAYTAWFIGGLALIMYGLPVPLAGVVGAALVIGMTSTVFGLIWTNTLQQLVPRERLGRVVSVDMLGSFGLLPIGLAIGGWATDWLGAQPVFLIGGAATAALALLGLAHPAIRNLD